MIPRLTSQGQRAALALLLAACARDDSASGSSTASTGSDTATEPTISYARCDGSDSDPNAGCDAEDCRERQANGASWSVCIPPCSVGADCPLAPGSNAAPTCDAGRCTLSCTPGIATCPSGMTCIEGTPAQCMWPLNPGVADLDALCVAACEGCRSGDLLGWTPDCASACATDLADCSDNELAEALLCPGDPMCSVGGLALNSCLNGIACKD